MSKMRLVNASITSHSFVCVCMLRTFANKFYSLSNFQIYDRVTLSILTIPRTYSSYNRKFEPFDPLHPFPHSLLAATSLFCFYEFCGVF